MERRDLCLGALAAAVGGKRVYAADAYPSHPIVAIANFGLVAPNGTPESVVATVYAAAVRAIRDPDIQSQLEATGSTISTSDSPSHFSAFIRLENRKWTEIVRLARVATV